MWVSGSTCPCNGKSSARDPSPQLQDRGLQFVHADPLDHRVVAQLIGLPMVDASLNPASVYSRSRSAQ